MKRLKITTYKSYAYMFRTDNLANLPCISSVDSSETFSEPGGTYLGIRLTKYIFSYFYTIKLTSNPKYYMVLFARHLSFFLLCFR